MTLAVGQTLQPTMKPPITREQLQAYAIAAEDSNPIHLDDAFAKEAGFPSVIVHGMLSMAFLGDHLLQNFPPSRFHVARLRTRFRKVTFPGEVIRCEGVIKKLLPGGGFTVTFTAKNQNLETTADGEADVFPTPSGNQ